MQVANELNNNLKNIAYYTKQIRELVAKQKDIDFELDCNLSNPDCKRFMTLTVIEANCTWIESLLKGIHANLLMAIEQDKLIKKN